MHKLRALFVVLLFVFFSCGTSEDTEYRLPPNDIDLIGTWDVIKIVYENTVVGTLEPSVTGTITFMADGTGRENYAYTVAGVTIPNVSSFTWRSTDTQIVFDEGTTDETEWERLEKSTTRQVGKFGEATGNTTITITIEK